MPRGTHASNKRSPAPIIAIVLVVVVVGAGAAFLLLKNKNATTGVDHSKNTPPLTWTVVGVNPVSATTNGTASVAAANRIAPAIESTMKLYYEDAFLDPVAWQSGQYQHAFNLMDPARQADAKAQIATLTAGPDAGSRYTDIQPLKSTIQIKVLIDSKGKPQTAVAIVDFKAKATTKSGGTHTIESTAQFFLEASASLSLGSPLPGQSPTPAVQQPPGAPQWVIIAWSAQRPDLPTMKPTPPGASATPSP